MDKKYKLNNKVTWAREDRPEVKILEKGRAALSLKEIIMILIGNGSDMNITYDISGRLCGACHHNIHELAKISIYELTKLGLTEKKAAIIHAAFELGNRRRSTEALQREKITGSHDIFEYMAPEMTDLKYEQFWIVLLNRASKVIKKINISEGGVSGTVADPKKIFKMALESNASSMILCHNHPSGSVQPSEADIRLTSKLKEAGLLLDLPVLDHLIFGGASYFSFADEGMV